MHLAGGLGATDLAPDLVALLLAQRAQHVVQRPTPRQRDDRAHVLLLEVHHPAVRLCASAEGLGQRIGRGVGAPQTAKVHQVPAGVVRGRLWFAGRRAVGRHGVRCGGQVGRGRQQGRVIRVVAGTEEDCRGVGWDGGQRLALRVADGRVQHEVRRLHLVTVHQRRDRHRGGIVRPVGRDDGQRLLVGVGPVRVPPGAVDGPGGERGGPRVGGGERVPGRASIASNRRRTARSDRVSAGDDAWSPTAGGQGGSAVIVGGTIASIAPDPGCGCEGNQWFRSLGTGQSPGDPGTYRTKVPSVPTGPRKRSSGWSGNAVPK